MAKASHRSFQKSIEKQFSDDMTITGFINYDALIRGFSIVSGPEEKKSVFLKNNNKNSKNEPTISLIIFLQSAQERKGERKRTPAPSGQSNS